MSDRKIIDFHTHVFPDKIAGRTIEKLEGISHYKAYTDGTFDGLCREMDESGVSLSVIQPVVTKPEQFKSVNSYAAMINVKYTDKLSFGGIHPDCSNYKREIDEIVSMGLKGIKLHPDYQNHNFNDIEYKHIVDYASDRGLITLVHAGVDIGYPDPVHCTPIMAAELIADVHPQNLVLAHMGGMFRFDEVEAVLLDFIPKDSKIYYDTACVDGKIDKEQFVRMIKKIGSDKVLFATDSPWSSQKSAIEWILESLNHDFSDEDIDNILYNNAARLLDKDIHG